MSQSNQGGDRDFVGHQWPEDGMRDLSFKMSPFVRAVYERVLFAEFGQLADTPPEPDVIVQAKE